MQIKDLIKEINDLIDDQLPDDQIIGWINDALAEIGTFMNAEFPEISTYDTYGEIKGLPPKWVRRLVKPFAAGRAKEQDSSQFEYTDLYRQFTDNIAECKMKFSVPKEYRLLAEQTLYMPDGSTYTVDSDMTLHKLAENYNTMVQDIIDLNDNILYVGDGLDADFSGSLWGGLSW